MREHEYDIVIIGSGAGGGTAARELAPLCAAGVRVAVLEWGARLENEDYTGRELEMVKKLYIDSGVDHRRPTKRPPGGQGHGPVAGEGSTGIDIELFDHLQLAPGP